MKINPFLISLFAWSLIGGLHVFTRYVDTVQYGWPNPVTWRDALYYVASYSIWSVLSVSTLALLPRVQLAKRLGRLSAVFLIGLILWLPLYFSFDFLVSVVMNQRAWSDYVATMVGTSAAIAFFYAVLYGLNFVVCITLLTAKRAKETQIVLAEQKMQLLQSQLSPHFLFNCLSAISGLARSDHRENLISAVAQVGHLLRFTIGNAKHSKIQLLEELELVDSYIALQRLRFKGRFEYRPRIDNINSYCLCPPFFIQALLENVFTHAVEASEDFIEIDLSLRLQQQSLSLVVSNSLPKTAETTTGLGSALNNLTTRLRLLYGTDCSFDTACNANMYQVSLVIPEDKITAYV